MISRMRIHGDDSRLFLLKQYFQLFDQLRFENMFDLVCLAINPTESDICKVNQIQFPESMVPHRLRGLSSPCGRQPKMAI